MAVVWQKKIFGVGPLGALLSFLLFGLAWFVDRWLEAPGILDSSAPLKVVGVILMALGLGLHFWSGAVLKNWWGQERLCTGGPFRFVRHPLYAAWIVLVCAGLSLFLNSWILLIWVVSLQPLWHLLVPREERMMEELFGDEYRTYAARTGRFIPRVAGRGRSGA